MTDKHIIIDGVDVAECENYGYRGKARYWCHNYDEPCTDYPNCYYKQLKRKEQEVQQAMDNYVQLDLQRVKEYNELVDLYKAKEQECEELKENYKWYDHYKEQALYNKNLCNEKSEQLDQLEKTLAEIKEITENIQSFVGRIDIEDDVFEQMEQILQKISECEGTNEN